MDQIDHPGVRPGRPSCRPDLRSHTPPRAAAVKDARRAPQKAARSVLDGREHDGIIARRRTTSLHRWAHVVLIASIPKTPNRCPTSARNPQKMQIDPKTRRLNADSRRRQQPDQRQKSMGNQGIEGVPGQGLVPRNAMGEPDQDRAPP